MDVGYYISELLGQHGDVNVPGLGYFAHTRVNGYYNDSEGKFYPPGYSVQFDPQFLDDDDILAVHIAEKKKISVASSKYFTEKYVLTLKQQAAAGETALADLGWFSMNNLQLLFRPNNVTSTDPEFFGYPVIKLNKIGRQPVATEAVAGEAYGLENTNEAYAPQPYIPEQPYQTADEEEEYLVELTRQKRRRNFWVFIILTLIAAGIAVFMVKRYNPAAFNFNFGAKEKEKKSGEPSIIMETIDSTKNKPDTAKTPLVPDTTIDSLSKNAITIKDTTAISRYEVIAGSFKDLAEAGKAIRQFKMKGIDAKIVPDMFGKRKKVSVGTYITMGLAEQRKTELITAKKIDPKSYVQFINPKDTEASPAKK